MESRKIQVQVIQAHMVRPPGTGGYKQYVVGDRIEIEESEFCANLHRKIKPPANLKKFKEEKEKEVENNAT